MPARQARLCTVNQRPIIATLEACHVGVQHRCTSSRHNRSSLAVVGARDTRAPPRLIGFFVFASDLLHLRSLRCVPSADFLFSAFSVPLRLIFFLYSFYR